MFEWIVTMTQLKVLPVFIQSFSSYHVYRQNDTHTHKRDGDNNTEMYSTVCGVVELNLNHTLMFLLYFVSI